MQEAKHVKCSDVFRKNVALLKFVFLPAPRVARRLSVQNFWGHETRLPTPTLDRLVAVLEALYSPATESHFLAYSTNFLLQLTSQV